MTTEIEEKSPLVIIHQKQINTHHHHALHCRRCGNKISRISRDRLVKLFLFWLPLKKYVCYRCHRKSYRWG
ncbi:hypothetical protein [Mucilaginibacter sp. SP1R1]|uniref:hypothetical protein n=1 Tax=Mucilaginibacter sp. SP1R1 TaxID=2723091 RepID=UPI003B00F005